MKIIAAQFAILLDDDPDPEEDLEKLLEEIGFAAPVEVTSLPDTKAENVLLVSFEPANGE